MIRLEHIYKRFETKGRPVHTALSDVNLQIDRGSIYGIIGRSGAGKSTLIRLLNLLERPSSGNVYLNGEDISAFKGAELRQLRHRIGMVFQHFNLLSSRTVLDNVCLPLRLVGVPKKEREARAMELLEIVGLTEHTHKYPAQLSGVQKQRVGIARSLANNPELLLCDEATSALDFESEHIIMKNLKQISAGRTLTTPWPPRRRRRTPGTTTEWSPPPTKPSALTTTHTPGRPTSSTRAVSGPAWAPQPPPGGPRPPAAPSMRPAPP